MFYEMCTVFVNDRNVEKDRNFWEGTKSFVNDIVLKKKRKMEYDLNHSTKWINNRFSKRTKKWTILIVWEILIVYERFLNRSFKLAWKNTFFYWTNQFSERFEKTVVVLMDKRFLYQTFTILLNSNDFTELNCSVRKQMK